MTLAAPNNNGFEVVKSAIIKNIPTEFVAQKFGQKIFLLITQFEKITNIYTVRNQTFNQDMMMNNAAKIYSIQQKFGAASMENEGAIRYLMNFIEQPHQEIIFSFGLKDSEELDRDILNEIRDVLVQIPMLSK